MNNLTHNQSCSLDLSDSNICTEHEVSADHKFSALLLRLSLGVEWKNGVQTLRWAGMQRGHRATGGACPLCGGLVGPLQRHDVCSRHRYPRHESHGMATGWRGASLPENRARETEGQREVSAKR